MEGKEAMSTNEEGHHDVCPYFGGDAWCPESAEEAKQVFANLAITFITDFLGMPEDENGQPVKLNSRAAAWEFYTQF